MKTPSASELLVQETRTAERLRLLMLANECKTIEEFRQRLADLLKYAPRSRGARCLPRAAKHRHPKTTRQRGEFAAVLTSLL